jgi:arsenate reductase (thioredoxin)
MKHTVLFLCTGNSARSQIAEALVNHFRGERWQAVSAGTHPTGYVHPFAIDALKEIGIDASRARSKSVDEFRDTAFDLVVTVCDSAAEECPLWPGQGQRAHIGFPDPARGTLEDFRSVRHDIQRRVIELLDSFERADTDKKCLGSLMSIFRSLFSQTAKGGKSMVVQIPGPSCANCLKLEMLVMQTLTELGIRDARVEKITTPHEMERLMTGDPPGLVINDQLVWSGGDKLPTKAQIAEWIREVAPALAL